MDDQINISGVIEEIYPEQVISDRFKKREFVLLHAPNPKFPQYLKIEFTQDKCDLLNMYSKGDSVECSINLKGQKYVSKKTGSPGYFNTIQAWRIMKDSAAPEPDEDLF